MQFYACTNNNLFLNDVGMNGQVPDVSGVCFLFLCEVKLSLSSYFFPGYLFYSLTDKLLVICTEVGFYLTLDMNTLICLKMHHGRARWKEVIEELRSAKDMSIQQLNAIHKQKSRIHNETRLVSEVFAKRAHQ